MGTKVLVNGNGFNSGVPVELRWGGPDGPLVGTSQTGDFSVPITLPQDAPAGVHYLVAVQKNPAGTTIGRAASAFELTGGTADQASTISVSAELWRGFSSRTPGVVAAPEPSGTELRVSSPLISTLGAGLVSFGVFAMAAVLLVILRSHTSRAGLRAGSGDRTA